MSAITQHLPLQPESIPSVLRSIPKWNLWRFEDIGRGKPAKVPYSPISQRRASVTNPADCADFGTTVQAYERGGMDGIGFVLTDDDDIVGIDLDAAIGLVDGAEKIIDEDAKRIVSLAQAAGAYIERSPSGKGLHIICRGTLPRACKSNGIEVYSRARYFTVTGHGRGDVVAAQEVIDDAVAIALSRREFPIAAPESPASRATRGSLRRSQVLDAVRSGWWDQLDDDAKDTELRLMLACFPQSVWDGGEQPWLTIIAACARSGAPHAEDIAREFSQRGACYSDQEFNSRYRSFQ